MAKSKKALKALKRRKEAKKRSRVVQERQDYREGGRVKANTGGLENLSATDFWKRGNKLWVKNKLVTPNDANYQGYIDRYNQVEAKRVADQQERQRVAAQQEQQRQQAAAATKPTTTTAQQLGGTQSSNQGQQDAVIENTQQLDTQQSTEEAEAEQQRQQALEAQQQAQQEVQQEGEFRTTTATADLATTDAGEGILSKVDDRVADTAQAQAAQAQTAQAQMADASTTTVTYEDFDTVDSRFANTPFDFSGLDVPEDSRTITPRINAGDGSPSYRVAIPWAAMTQEQRDSLLAIADEYPNELERAKAAYNYLKQEFGLRSRQKETTADSPFNFTMDVPEGTTFKNITINDGFGNQVVAIPWGALSEQQRRRIKAFDTQYPGEEEASLKARAVYNLLKSTYGLLSDKQVDDGRDDDGRGDDGRGEEDFDDLAGDTGDTDDRSDETDEEIENPYVEKREIKGLAKSQIENATGAFKDHVEKWGLRGGYTNTFGLFDKQETKLYWRNFRGWEQQNPEPDRFVNAQGQPTNQSVDTLGTGAVGTSATSGNRINPKWNQWNTKRLFAHNDIVSNIIKLPRYGGVEGGEDSRYGQIKPVKTEQFGKGTTVPYKIPGLEADDVDKADVATVIDPETGEPSEDTEADTFEIDREAVAEVEDADQVTATDISAVGGTADQILKTKASELGVTAPTVEAYTSSSANYFLKYPEAKKAVEEGQYTDFLDFHEKVGKGKGYDTEFEPTEFAAGEISRLGEAFRATLTETQAATRDTEAEQEALADTPVFTQDTRSMVDPVTGETVQLAATADAEKQQRKAITDEEAAQGTEAIIAGSVGYEAAQRRQVKGEAAKGAAKSLLQQVGEIPGDISEAILDDPAVVTAQVDTQPVEVQAAIAALPQEALVSAQLENLLAGIDEGKTPLWARPAVQLVESNLAARGLSVSTVGRDALFNAIIQSAIPLAQSNATALQQRAAQNLSNEQQANLQQASQEMQLRLTNLANRQSAESQSAQLAQQINLTQGQFTQQARLTESEQFQQARMASLQNEQQAAMVNLGNDQQMEMANLQVEAERLGANQNALNQERLAEMQVAANFLEKNAAFKQQMELANISNEQQMRLAFLSAKNQAESENLSAAQQTELANLNKRLEVNKRNAELAQQMGLAQLNVDQQRAMQNAATVANIDMTKFNAAQQTELANSKFMQTATLQDLNNRQQAIMQDATTLASMDLAAADARTKVSIENARNFLAMDMANLTNEQQAYMLDSQQRQQRLLSDVSIQNAARQFNATSDLQTQQYTTSLAAQLQQFNVQQANAMKQFNASEANRIAAIEAGNDLAAQQFNAQIQTQIRQFNSQQDLQIEQFNTANAQAVEQSNVEWRRKANLADTAAINAANQQQAAFQFDLNKTALSQAWQSLRDQANFDFTEFQSDKERKISAINALLGNEAFMTEDKYNTQRNRLLYLMDQFGNSLESTRDVDVLEIPADLTA